MNDVTAGVQDKNPAVTASLPDSYFVPGPLLHIRDARSFIQTGLYKGVIAGKRPVLHQVRTRYFR